MTDPRQPAGSGSNKDPQDLWLDPIKALGTGVKDWAMGLLWGNPAAGSAEKPGQSGWYSGATPKSASESGNDSSAHGSKTNGRSPLAEFAFVAENEIDMKTDDKDKATKLQISTLDPWVQGSVNILRGGMEKAGYQTQIPKGSAYRTDQEQAEAIARDVSHVAHSKHQDRMAFDLVPRGEKTFGAYAAANPKLGVDNKEYTIEMREWWLKIRKDRSLLAKVPSPYQRAFLKYLLTLKGLVDTENKRLKSSGRELRMGDEWGETDIKYWDPTHVEMHLLPGAQAQRVDAAGASDQPDQDGRFQQQGRTQNESSAAGPAENVPTPPMPQVVEVELPNLPVAANTVEPTESNAVPSFSALDIQELLAAELKKQMSTARASFGSSGEPVI